MCHATTLGVGGWGWLGGWEERAGMAVWQLNLMAVGTVGCMELSLLDKLIRLDNLGCFNLTFKFNFNVRLTVFLRLCAARFPRKEEASGEHMVKRYIHE